MQLNEIIEKLKTDKMFAEKYAVLGNIDAIINQAKQDGFNVSREDIEKIMLELGREKKELSEAELAFIAGGVTKCGMCGQFFFVDTKKCARCGRDII